MCERKEGNLMANREELFAAVRLISNHCALQGNRCSGCPLLDWCDRIEEREQYITPDVWPDPEEGGGEK